MQQNEDYLPHKTESAEFPSLCVDGPGKEFLAADVATPGSLDCNQMVKPIAFQLIISYNFYDVIMDFAYLYQKERHFGTSFFFINVEKSAPFRMPIQRDYFVTASPITIFTRTASSC